MKKTKKSNGRMKERKEYKEFVAKVLREWMECTVNEWKDSRNLRGQDFWFIYEESHEDLGTWVKDKFKALEILEFASTRYVPSTLVEAFLVFEKKESVLAKTIALARAVLYWDVKEALKEKFQEELAWMFKKA